MKPNAHYIKKKQINFFNVFPINREFYFLDSYEKIEDFKTANFEDPEYICVVAEIKDGSIKENLYIRKDFFNDYDFIKVTEKKSNIDLSFIISKTKINIGRTEIRLLTEIKARPILMKEIYMRSKINFNTNYMILKELFTIPNELKFYNRVFILSFQGSKLNINLNNQNQQNNNYNNNFNMNFNYANNFPNNNQLMNNNHINNNAFAMNDFNNINKDNNIGNSNNNNQILNNNIFNSYKNKEDRKGHTGFL